MKKIFCLLLIVCGCIGFAMTAGSIARASQMEMTDDACAEFKKSDAELNRVYKQLIESKQGRAEFIKKLRSAQRAWVQFRDAHMASLNPLDEKPAGSARPMCHCIAINELTNARIKQLKEIATPVEGDVCGSF